jgi:hypothetical protein
LKKYKVSLEGKRERVGRLKPEEKVNMAIDMSQAMLEACGAGIRAANPKMTEQELMKELRRRLRLMKQWQRPTKSVK